MNHEFPTVTCRHPIGIDGEWMYFHDKDRPMLTDGHQALESSRMLTRLLRRNTRRGIVWLMLGAMGMSSLSGCSRQFWRMQADKDTYNAISPKLSDERWQLPRMDVTPDARSRFYDPFDPDKEPLPPDDPAAHEYMHCVNGKKGYKFWHKLGTAFAIENPQWLEPYGIQMQGTDPVLGHSSVKLLKINLPQAMDLASIHSRNYQSAIEDLYTAALDLTAKRYALGVRYLNAGGAEPGASVSKTSSGGVFGPNSGVAAIAGSFGVSQLLPTGGQIALEIANTVTWGLGPGGASAPSLGYSFTQPLLFNAGRKVALEPLTQAERQVLYSARVLARFRQQLFTDVSVAYLNVLQQRQGILNTINNIRLLEEQLVAQEARDSRIAGIASAVLEGGINRFPIPPELATKLRLDENFIVWEGPLSPEEEALLLGMSEDPDFQAAAQEIIGFKKQRATTLSYLQLKDQYNRAQNNLATNQRALADQQDALKLVLGLPPNITLEIETSMLSPFELISSDLLDLEYELRKMQVSLGTKLLPIRQPGDLVERPPEFDGLKSYVDELAALSDSLYELGLSRVQQDFDKVKDILERTQDDWNHFERGQRYFRSEAERTLLVTNVEDNLRVYRFSERSFAVGQSLLKMLTSTMNARSPEELISKLDTNRNGVIDLAELPENWAELPRKGNEHSLESYTVPQLLTEIGSAARIIHDENLLRVAQGLEVVQAALRVELIALNPFSLDGSKNTPDIEEVIRIALENRHDLMNSRAAVMDARRKVEFAANALEAGLDLTFSGQDSLGTGNRTRQSAGLRFTTPLDQIQERNDYRIALIAYQRARRAYMLLEDQIKLAVRTSWRQIQTREYQVEIDRTNVRIVALQYDSASLQAAGAQQTNALSLVNALNSVLNTQNALVGDWINYEANRLNIYRDMGIMEIDPRGVWTDPFYLQMDNLLNNGDVSPPAAAPDAVLPVPEPQN